MAIPHGALWVPNPAAQPRRASIGVFVRALTTPAIYSLALPLALLDLWVTTYQWICFPIYGIAPVPRRRYFVMDRHSLPGLSLVERANCTYCAYATGVVAYVREITARTEQYWCPIKHRRAVPSPHERYEQFLDYRDAETFRRHLDAMRRRLHADAVEPGSTSDARLRRYP